MSGAAYETERVLTVANALSTVRLLAVPAFLWLVVAVHEDGWAVAVLVLAGLTDLLDGRLARRLHQVSRIGQVLDPLADRLAIAAILVGLALRAIIPWWLVGLLLARDLVLLSLVPLLRTRGCTSLPVHFLGKLATFCLLYAFPFVLLGSGHHPLAAACRTLGWAFALWGAGLYWWAGGLYLAQAARWLARPPRVRPASPAAERQP